MTDDSFEKFWRDLDQARAAHRRAIDRAIGEIHDAITNAQAEMREARREFRKKIDRTRREVARLSRPAPKQGKRRRRDDGGELEPVTPKPKPKPLVGGAEAPIE